jgi:hypothetical protein
MGATGVLYLIYITPAFCFARKEIIHQRCFCNNNKHQEIVGDSTSCSISMSSSGQNKTAAN